jgi:antitoxin (DNA-binding transcriptional repressor) of toxin-antitoxin stability system
MKFARMVAAKALFSALVEAVQRGESILVKKSGKPAAQFGPVADQPPRDFGSIATSLHRERSRSRKTSTSYRRRC